MDRVTIANKHWYKGKISPIYCGRGSVLGNPYVIGADGDRNAVCAKYQVYFDGLINDQNNPITIEVKRIYKIARTTNVVLLCFCAPAKCHCITIKNEIDKHLLQNGHGTDAF